MMPGKWQQRSSDPNRPNCRVDCAARTRIMKQPFVCLVGMKMVGNSRENVLTIPAPVFFCRELKREWEGRTGKRNRYYGISGTEYFERERLDYDREAVTQNGNIYM